VFENPVGIRGVAQVIVFVPKKKYTSCWHKVVVVDKHSFSLCDKEITQLQVDIAEHTN